MNDLFCGLSMRSSALIAKQIVFAGSVFLMRVRFAPDYDFSFTTRLLAKIQLIRLIYADVGIVFAIKPTATAFC